MYHQVKYPIACYAAFERHEEDKDKPTEEIISQGFFKKSGCFFLQCEVLYHYTRYRSEYQYYRQEIIEREVYFVMILVPPEEVIFYRWITIVILPYNMGKEQDNGAGHYH